MYRTLRVLGIAVLALVVIGMVILASASEVNGLRLYHTPYGFVVRQAIWLGVAFVFMLAASYFDYHRWRDWPWLTICFYVGVALLMAIVLALPATKGSHRWLRLGSFAMQPSEFGKILTVVATSVLLDRIGWRIERFWKGAVPAVLVVGVIMGLAVAEPDFGTTIVVALTAGVLLFVAGMKFWHMIIIAAVGGLGVGALLALNANRMNRIMAWLPESLALKLGVTPETLAANAENSAKYQLEQALVAIKNGGVTGTPLFRGKQKLAYLPEAHTDFIFAIGAEEWGLIFSLLVLTFFVILFICGMIIAANAPDRLGRLVAYGMTFLIFFQAIFNMGVVTGLLPTKGLALPFLSYGGTNLITAMVAVGTLFNIGRQIELPTPRSKGAGMPAFRAGIA